MRSGVAERRWSRAVGSTVDPSHRGREVLREQAFSREGRDGSRVEPFGDRADCRSIEVVRDRMRHVVGGFPCRADPLGSLGAIRVEIFGCEARAFSSTIVPESVTVPVMVSVIVPVIVRSDAASELRGIDGRVLVLLQVQGNEQHLQSPRQGDCRHDDRVPRVSARPRRVHSLRPRAGPLRAGP